MDSICGIVTFGDRPPSETTLHTMMSAIPDTDCGSVHTWRAEGVMLAHRAGPPFAPDATGDQPRVSQDGSLCVVADARIDGRRELLEALRASGSTTAEQASDAELILAGYRAWGDACLDYLVGDFAFAIWDARAGRLFLGRDALGVRQLYYARTDSGLVFGSTLGAVRDALPLPLQLNIPLLRDYAADRVELWIGQTAYQDIQRLPASHALSISPAAYRCWQYYVFGTESQPDLGSHEAWIEAFRNCFADSLNDRLPDRSRLAVLTGGGLDSSAIACMAHHMVESGERDLTVDLVFAAFERSPAADESKYFDQLVAHCRTFGKRLVPADDRWTFRQMLRSSELADEPEVDRTREMLLALQREAHDSGARVVLAGLGANQILADACYVSRAVFRELSLAERWIEGPHFRRAKAWSTLALLFEMTLRPILARRLPEPLRRRLRRGFAKSRRSTAQPGSAASVARAKPQLEDSRSRAGFERADGLSAAAVVAHDLLRSPRHLAILGQLDWHSRALGIEMRLPFLDRRLASLMAHLPRALYFERGQDRRVLRLAMAGLMPESLRLRRDHAEFTDLVRRGFEHEGPGLRKLMDAPTAAALGMLDANAYNAQLVAALEAAQDSTQRRFNIEFGHLWAPIAVEQWLTDAMPYYRDGPRDR